MAHRQTLLPALSFLIVTCCLAGCSRSRANDVLPPPDLPIPLPAGAARGAWVRPTSRPAMDTATRLTKTFAVLGVTSDEPQLQAMIRATVEVLKASALGRAVAGNFVFALKDEVHPMTIGDCWRKLDGSRDALIGSKLALE